MDNSKKIIISFIALFLLSSVYLSAMEVRQADPNTGKDWWALYFSDPKSGDLSFVIENHSNKTDFKYEILDGKNRIYENDAIIVKGETREINLDQKIGGIENKKITIRVSDGKYKKEIYKNFDN